MDFSIPEPIQAILAAIREILERAVLPLEPRLGSRPFAELVPALAAVRDEVKARGLWAPQLPRSLGGMGLTLMEFAFVAEELGRSPLGHYAFNCQAPDAGNMELLREFATDSQQERWLVPLARGEIRSCFAMTEPDYPGSNPVWMGTRAVRGGDGYVIDGRKWFASGADGARFAIVMAVTDPDAEPHRRASLLIVPADAPGFRRVRNISCMGHAGDDWASHAELAFEACRVPRENLLGEEGAGFAMAQARLGPGRIHHAMRWIGVCRRAFDLMCDRAAGRLLAPGDPLGSRQAVQQWIAEGRAAIDAARLLVLHAAWTIDAQGAEAAREAISLVKFHVAGVMQQVIDRAIQAHGALGISDDTVLSWFYRQERAARIYDGPDEVHKAVVARRILKGHGRRADETRVATPPPVSGGAVEQGRWSIMGVATDEAGPVRAGEQLDLERLGTFLAVHLGGAGDSLAVEQFPHGHSNLTYLIRLGDRELVLRRPPFGNRVKSAHDMGREYRILSRLCRVYGPAPCPVLFCDDEGVLGAPFYLMERRRGIILRKPPPADRPIPPEAVRRLCESLIDGLARLHALDYEAAGLGDLGKPEGYVERQVTGWTRRYRDAQTDEVPGLDRAAEWLAANRTTESGAALIHNDYKFDNLVLDPDDPGRIVAVLDWEMATIGDPLMDLGTTLGYWIEPTDPEPLRRFLAGPTVMPGSLTRRELAGRYAEAAGRELPDLLFYHVYGLFKIAVIAQQIYARYVRGATQDPRFAALGGVVAALGESAVRAIDAGRF